MLVVKFFTVVFLVMGSVPVLILFIEILLAATFRKKITPVFSLNVKSKVVALIPAHNESIHLVPTLESVKSQSLQDIEILVVADNCDDDTAAIAETHGATVIERKNLQQKGKGYALDYGIRYLSSSQHPDIVVIIDADCIAEKHAFEKLVMATSKTNSPIQANYLMRNGENPNIKMKIAEFAWMLKNYVRPLGFYRLGLPCQLTGSGMAFRWDVISKVSFATGHIVEDMKLGLDFAAVGNAPQFCPHAHVHSFFPTNEEGIKTQRTRWEHGHLGIMFKEVPRLLVKAVRCKNIPLFALGLDLLVPPLSLMAVLLFLVFSLTVLLTTLSSSFTPLLFSAGILVILFAFAMTIYWIFFGYKVLSLKHLFIIPYYIFLKFPIYLKFVFNRQEEWVRSKRDKDSV